MDDLYFDPGGDNTEGAFKPEDYTLVPGSEACKHRWSFVGADEGATYRYLNWRCKACGCAGYSPGYVNGRVHGRRRPRITRGTVPELPQPDS